MLQRIQKFITRDTGWWIFAIGVFVGAASFSGSVFEGATMAGFGGSVFHLVRSLMTT